MASARFQFFTRRPENIEWRLISSNNWELGRCAAPVDALDACLAVVLDLKGTIDGCAEEVLPDGGGGWRWRLMRGDDAVAVSSRVFQRRVECESTLTRFCKVAGVAPCLPILRSFH